jgi:hypothetical protein
MLSYRAFLSVVFLAVASTTLAQSPSVLYTWNGTGNVQQWVKNFGTNTLTLDNNIPGELTLIETGTAGSNVAVSDGANRVRESSTAASGGLDLTGLDFLEFDIGHNGAGPINVQFYTQGSTGFTFSALGPDIAVTPGVNTYQVPLTGLPPDQIVYLRTIGFNARDHLALGNVNWTLREVRSGGTPLTQRNLITHDVGSPEGGLQGAIVNFDNAAVQGNNGGQNQTGLSHNPAGTGSLQWTDVGGSNGAAISWGNGTALNGNTFNLRTTDLSNYQSVTIRMSALDPNNLTGTVNVQSFFQTNNFQFQAAGNQNLVTDGQFHDLTFSLAGLVDMNVVDQTGINLGSHPNNLTINVDLIQFNVPEPGSLAALAALGALALLRRTRA